ncbi:hypothetical protein VNO77_50918 [Canavalia gladiata]|uniref:Uncharacterized protein n=1 Tax=Canavalia gladiata TaxID=3824 RepID=A0AAN9JBP4_CANGL
MDVFLTKKEIGKLRHRIRPLANQSQNQSKEAANNSNFSEDKSSNQEMITGRIALQSKGGRFCLKKMVRSIIVKGGVSRERVVVKDSNDFSRLPGH